MEVENPRFDAAGLVECADCPFANRFGDSDAEWMQNLCGGGPCPTADDYAAACELAEKEKLCALD